jgi:hypothetical protein
MSSKNPAQRLQDLNSSKFESSDESLIDNIDAISQQRVPARIRGRG